MENGKNYNEVTNKYCQRIISNIKPKFYSQKERK